MSDERLRKLIGSFGYAFFKRHVRGVMLRIDTEGKKVIVTKNGEKHEIKFDEIERAVNE